METANHAVCFGPIFISQSRERRQRRTGPGRGKGRQIWPVGILLVAPGVVYNLAANIDGAQANAGAGTGSRATGIGLVSYDDVSGLFSWNISWTPLLGNITVAHFHGPAGPGANAGVQVNFLSLGGGTTSPSIGSTTITALQGADLLAGLWYINIHSDIFPAGEIRGQVNLVPIPAAAWLLLSGLGALGFWRRR